jgi:integrase
LPRTDVAEGSGASGAGCTTKSFSSQTFAIPLVQAALTMWPPSIGPAWRDHGLVRTTPIGDPLSMHGLLWAFRWTLGKAGLPRMRFHELRHTHASLLLARGVHPKVVSERLGHASISITMDTYSHVLPSLQEEAVRDFDRWIAGAVDTSMAQEG